MSLNDYTEEVHGFLRKMHSDDKDNKQKIEWLKEEFSELESATLQLDKPKMQHQVYDMMYLLFEIAAANEMNLDREWAAGTKRKSEKYLKKIVKA